MNAIRTALLAAALVGGAGSALAGTDAPAMDTGAPTLADERRARLDAADAEVQAALKAVADAKAKLEQGGEPLPGERSATALGRTRLNDGYFQRQQTLRQDLERANARLEQAYRQRNDAR